MRVLVFILICLTISVDVYSQEGEGTSKAQKFEIRPQDSYRGDPLKGLNLGEEIKALEFGGYFALIIGIVVGTYSSIYVASAAALALGVSKHDLIQPKKEGEPIDDMP